MFSMPPVPAVRGNESDGVLLSQMAEWEFRVKHQSDKGKIANIIPLKYFFCKKKFDSEIIKPNIALIWLWCSLHLINAWGKHISTHRRSALKQGFFTVTFNQCKRNAETLCLRLRVVWGAIRVKPLWQPRVSTGTSAAVFYICCRKLNQRKNTVQCTPKCVADDANGWFVFFLNTLFMFLCSLSPPF